MPAVDRPNEQDSEEDRLPEGTTTVIWAAVSGGFRLGNPDKYPEECFPDDLDLSPVPARFDGTTSPTVTYEPGEELPLPVAKDIWPDWSERMIAINNDGKRVDSTGDKNLSPEALERWRVRNE
ncbi:hypothetical protein DVK00_03215 [Haloarcula sp. Atlit-47R]|jgi:hypothetical protein|uniref:hypothetical protein n=1 Tax=Haloarcula sp. Atlit-47R TaxID=2282132 RepID=UPI000EF20CA6|nr:hypothetical protein [Haloarcula sp. Atlit-47R]RLM47532.1 hypothetical protein DVK00_03215 [Haloarcula sp. Atlit-47R]